MRTCLKNNIALLYLPPHSLYILQPLDLSIFAPVKAYYYKEIAKLNGSNLDNVSRVDFIKIYYQIRLLALSQSNIKAG